MPYALFKDGEIVKCSVGANMETLKGFMEVFKQICADYKVEIKEVKE